ncbi:MAG: phenylacetic acid degradation protein, partial [Sandarakinorhabdus sp.]|nr:phenylacetic acid degradation protein [Sandarakinorhabdus sp.]
ARTTTTIESKTNMMAAAPARTLLRATATPLHIGGRTSVWTTRIETPDGKLVSVTTQTQMVL